MADITHMEMEIADIDAIDAEHIARVGPEVKRKVTPGLDGIRLLVIGATPGESYETGGTL